ncbi:hypothetical protein GIY62_32900 [Burkholderia plantarii]|uniref:hypothetical protein n=1 Tax=Burkholderia plantarii TaxID=41899 RepID=UPI0027295A7A|nr:hypothetical protein [Burkholderia plantarii]WLE62196.1 hypothetical protein GIY62_32900 [Burkholderia plantarii]
MRNERRIDIDIAEVGTATGSDGFGMISRLFWRFIVAECLLGWQAARTGSPQRYRSGSGGAPVAACRAAPACAASRQRGGGRGAWQRNR